MFARISTLALFALTASASMLARDQCNTGSIHCCNQLQAANSDAVTGIAGLLGIAANVLTGQAGINCSPIDVIGAGSNSCTAQPVCCTGNHFNGLIVVGCSPINLGL